MKNKFLFITFIYCLIVIRVNAQQCELTFAGTVIDPHESQGLSGARIYIEESNQQLFTDSIGFFKFSNLCKGTYHITIDHSSCESQKLFIDLLRDTFLLIELEHHGHFLQSITIEGSRVGSEGASQNTIRYNEIEKHSGEPLAVLLEQITGVSSYKNGSGIAKPIINGMSGNRISILNNGIVQAGQQWGSDHAPEIDPFSVEQIKVIKGVDVIAYGGNSLGGVVLMEPASIPKDPHLHGIQLISFQTNGNLLAYASKLEVSKKKFDCRWTLGGKYGGDRSTPDYYLTNTGLKELSSSIFFIRDRIKNSTRIYASIFNTELGILRGSHIGNVTDLQQAITKEIPLFTQEQFSYQIESPKQKVGHYLIKFSHQRQTKVHLYEMIAAAQINHRREFDVRRNGRSSTPALNLLMQSYNVDFKDRFELRNHHFNYGVQSKLNVNTNQSGTGILPLIPNYNLYNLAAYLQWKRVRSSVTYEGGLRYDMNSFNVTYQSKETPQVFQKGKHNFQNFNLAGGIKYKVFEPWVLRLNIGLAQRSPEVNELYSSGLHQAVAGIEEGNINLMPEHSYKAMATSSVSISHRLIFETNIYCQKINRYIYLEPQKEFRLTIRGAFPLFIYKQTDALIYGLDVLAKVELNDQLNWVNRFSYIKSKDLINQVGIPYIPSHQLTTSINYGIDKILLTRNLNIEIGGKYVFRRSDLLESQDFLASPDAYFLMNARIAFDFKVRHEFFNISAQADNILNNKYRDYLNRLRYFANEEGINVKLALKWSF